jgi:hypothetical protein
VVVVFVVVAVVAVVAVAAAMFLTHLSSLSNSKRISSTVLPTAQLMHCALVTLLKLMARSLARNVEIPTGSIMSIMTSLAVNISVHDRLRSLNQNLALSDNTLFRT